MRRLLLAIGLVSAGLLVKHKAGAWGLTCFWRQGHHPVRHPLGGWRCSMCGAPIADIGYVSPLRRTFSPKHGGEVTRTYSYEAEPQPVRRMPN